MNIETRETQEVQEPKSLKDILLNSDSNQAMDIIWSDDLKFVELQKQETERDGEVHEGSI